MLYGHLQQIHLQRPSFYGPSNLSHLQQNHLQLRLCHLQLYYLQGHLQLQVVFELQIVSLQVSFVATSDHELCVGEISGATGNAATKKEAKRKCAENALENDFKIIYNIFLQEKNDFSKISAYA